MRPIVVQPARSAKAQRGFEDHPMNRTQRDEAILAAGREGLCRRLIEEKRLPERIVEEWLVAWAAEAQRRGVKPDVDYWRHGARWILAQRAEGKRPPSPPV